MMTSIARMTATIVVISFTERPENGPGIGRGSGLIVAPS
jgi:hypothetical protein